MDLREIKFEKYSLPNGLDVILHEDHSIPIVAVNIWYHVGSKNEKPGRTGFAHLFEHMMFQGSQHHDDEFFGPLQKAGAALNGSTSEDRTNYWENLPSNYLELALWLESDRMGFLLPAMTQEKLDNQRDVVKNERRQSMDNQPYMKAYEVMLPLIYPKDHPYSWPVIGSMADLSAASIEDISEFFRMYYTPNNVSLCVAGDIQPELAKELIAKYFGAIPPGPPVDRLRSWVPQLDGVRRAVAEDNVSLARLYYLWPTPGQYQPGDAEFDLLANILGSGKTSRLYKKLVYETQIAQEVAVYQSSNELNSLFGMEVTAREGHTMSELEQAVDEELRNLLMESVTEEELSRAKNEVEADFTRSLQQVGGFGGRADRLNGYNVMLGDPGRFAWDLKRYTGSTNEVILHYAKQYLDLNRRAVLHIVPQGELLAAGRESDRSQEPKPLPEPVFTPPQIQTLKLSNGLDILLVEDHRLPLVQINLITKSGFAADPPDLPGVASLTSELLDEGTTSRNALEIADAIKSIGAELYTFSWFDSSQVHLNVLKKNLDPGLELMSDVILNPTFPHEELERQRLIYRGRIQKESKEPGTVARKIFLRTLFGPEHPYGQPFTGSGTEDSIKKIWQEDLVNYYKANYNSNNSAVVVAGDLTRGEAVSALEKYFRTWPRSGSVRREIPPPQMLNRIKICLADKPGAPQSMIFVGGPGIRRNDPDYSTTTVVNSAFGGKFTSRLNMNLREEKGYTYGARSGFLETREPGAFIAYAPVQTQNTKDAIVEILKELRDITSTRPLTDEELNDAKENIIKSFPQQFQTLGGIAGELGEIVTFDLPLDEWHRFLSQVKAVTRDMAAQAAKKHLHPDALLIVVVGDREKIEAGIRELALGEITYLDPAAF